jgi:hypothetical protein
MKNELMPTAFLLDYDKFTMQQIEIVATKFENQKPILWAIKKSSSVFSKYDGLFYSDVLNSSN